MRTNVKTKSTIITHEGAPAKRTGLINQLSRSVMACMLWEKSFYEEGKDIANRIGDIIAEMAKDKSKNYVDELTGLAIAARTKMKLRHAPLLIAVEMAKHKNMRCALHAVLANIIQRPDELTEFLALYWKDGKKPIPNQAKRGLAAAFSKFNEYQLAKWG